jgi:hypothetical protein
MGQKCHFVVHNQSKVFDLINPVGGHPINRINELNGLHNTAEGYRFAFMSVLVKHIAVTTLTQTV